MRFEFVRVTQRQGPPLFMVWDRSACVFETHNGQSRWTSWNIFEKDLRASLGARPAHQLLDGEVTDDLDDERAHRLEAAVRRYRAAAPLYVKEAGKPQLPEHSRARQFLGNLGIWGMLALFVLMLGSGLWSSVLYPFLGWLGAMEYTSPSQRRYERFLTSTARCSESKKVFTANTGAIPVFQSFRCPNGEERIWTYRVDRVSKTADGKWILE